MRKTVLVVVLLAVALLVLPLAIGSMLPQGHVAASSITLAQPVDSVWSVLRDIGSFGSWWDDVERMERRAGEGREIWVQYDRRNQAMPMEVIVSTPPSRFVTRIVDEGLPFGGTWTYEVVAAPEGSTVTITETGEIYNPVFRLVARWFLGYHRTMDGFLTALGARFGEQVTPRHVDGVS